MTEQGIPEELEETSENIKQTAPISDKLPFYKTLDRSDFIALFALLISMGSMLISVYEANVLRAQQNLMQEQKAASVWPYLQPKIGYVYSTEGITITYACENKGIGPALIEKMEFSIAEKKITSYDELHISLEEHFPDVAKSISYGSLEGSVLSANDRQDFLKITMDNFSGAANRIRALNLQIDLCYCSIYEDCWRISGDKPVRTAGCTE